MSEAVLFHNDNSLDFEDVRQQVLRIPEVMSELRRAQSLWDKSGQETIDFVSYLNSEDAHFFRSSSIRELVQSVVQLGLYRRFIDRHGLPQFIVGNTRNVSSTLVAIGKTDFTDMVFGCRATQVDKASGVGATAGHLPVLRGQLLPSFQAYKLNDGKPGYSQVGQSTMQPARCLRYLTEEFGVDAVVAIGPGSFHLPEEEKVGRVQDLVCRESIDMDPQLSWFWPRVKALHDTA